MRRILKQGVLSLIVCLSVLVSTAWGVVPQEALSAKPAGSIYAVLNIEDLGGLARNVFSSENVDLLTPLLDEDALNGIRMTSAIMRKLPIKTAALVVGTDENLVPFLQVAMALPSELQSQLELVAQGKASAEDIVSLVLGDGALAFGALFSAEPKQGAQGTWYSLNGQLAVAARDGLFLIGLSPSDLESSVQALASPEVRLSVKRRHDTKSFSLLHLDFPALIRIAKAQEDQKKADEKKLDDIDLDALKKYFKAPLEIEYGFERKPDSFLVSVGANIEEALASSYLERLLQMKPVQGGGLFLAGAGRPLLALSTQLAFKGSDLDIYPEISQFWREGLKALESYGISENEVEKLLSGSVSLVVGGAAAFAGAPTPGAYLAVTGRDGAAASIFGKITGSESFAAMVPVAPVDVKDWEAVLQVDPGLAPVPVVLGVKGETLFLGIQDIAGLNALPELSGGLKALLEKSSMSTSFIDFEAIRLSMDRILNDQASPLQAFLADVPPMVLASVKEVLGAELSVPFLGIWAPRVSEAFMALSLVDVPADKGLVSKFVKEAAKFIQP